MKSVNLLHLPSSSPFALAIEDAVRYAGTLLAPAEGFGQGFFAGKNKLFMLLKLILGIFWCSVVTSVTFSSNLRNFKQEKNQDPHTKNILIRRNKKKEIY